MIRDLAARLIFLNKIIPDFDLIPVFSNDLVVNLI